MHHPGYFLHLLQDPYFPKVSGNAMMTRSQGEFGLLQCSTGLLIVPMSKRGATVSMPPGEVSFARLTDG